MDDAIRTGKRLDVDGVPWMLKLGSAFTEEVAFCWDECMVRGNSGNKWTSFLNGHYRHWTTSNVSVLYIIQL